MIRFALVMLVLLMSTAEPVSAQIYGNGSVTVFGSQYGGTVTFYGGSGYPPTYYSYPPPVIVSPPGYYGYYPAPVFVPPPRYYGPPRYYDRDRYHGRGRDHDRRPGSITYNPNKPQEPNRPPAIVTNPRHHDGGNVR